MGEDGNTSSTNRFIARDAYGFSLNYFNGDYASINVNPFAEIGTLANTGNDLFNGNIASMVVNLPTLGNAKIYGYKFDQLNRLTKMDVYEGLNNATNAFSATGLSGAYTERLSYDANGNIQTYLRKDENGSEKNNYQYTYATGTNRLSSIYNTVNSQTKSYSYDAIGNTTEDGMQGTTVIDWNVYGKVRSLTNSASQGVTYTYGADGQRAGKVIGSIKEWYVRDASGNIMVTYTKDAGINAGNLSTKEFYKYGSSLLAIKHKVVDMETVPNADEEQTIIRGEDDYLLTDHLGNTRAIVSDKKLQEEDPMNAGEVLYYEADVKAAYYYSAYGAISKTYGSDPVVAFNGQRKSDEIGTDAQTALYWEYNGDVGRRWNLDPKSNTSLSPYNVFAANPIFFTDPFGDTTHYYSMKGKFLGAINNDGSLNRVKVNEKMWNKVGGQLSQKMGIKGKFENQQQRNDYVAVLNNVLDRLESTGKYGDLISRETGLQNLSFTGLYSEKTHLASGILSLNSVFDNGSTLSINQWESLSGTVVKGGKILYPLPNRDDYVGTGIEGRPKGKGFDKDGVSYVLIINDFPVTSIWNRGLFRVHPDGNSPGSAGCIALQSGKEGLLLFKSLMQNYIQTHGNITISVNIANNPNIGYIKENEKGKKKINYGE